jgi:hypothetical protein
MSASFGMNTSLEQRLEAVEAAIAELKQRLAPVGFPDHGSETRQQKSHPEPNWIEQITGSFKDDPIFEEVLAYGREFRYADRPSDDRLTES